MTVTGRVLARLRELEGAELLAWRDGDEACVWTERGELRFRPAAASVTHSVGRGTWTAMFEALELERG